MSARDDIDQVLGVVSEHFAVTKTEIVSACRAHKVLTARRIGMYLALKTSGATAEEIGARFGGADYTNVLMVWRAMQRLAESNPDQAELLRRLERRCVKGNS